MSAAPHGVVCNADLCAACIGGAAQQDDYRRTPLSTPSVI
jgi:hypothetical protein